MSTCFYCGDDPGLPLAEPWQLELLEPSPILQPCGLHSRERVRHIGRATLSAGADANCVRIEEAL